MAQKPRQSSITLFARDLNITWGDDKRYWNWIPVHDACSNELVDAAELIKVCYLDARTKFDTSVLDPGTRYEVAFSLMMNDNAEGWVYPVKLGFVMPNEFEDCRDVDFSKLEKNKSTEVPIGQFIAPSEDKAGKMEIYMSETKEPWKKGMVLKGVVIRSKN
ncbi:Phloem protein 2-like protein [Melia azedarach]|uniref:Phloem protein 2-like protein n=1 Tax=Melia azedarach TaxID=155640 RepID=A0ACC1WUA0_MELAZ|nr:Phloem protein 2-like protein [Melia azedarach]